MKLVEKMFKKVIIFILVCLIATLFSKNTYAASGNLTVDSHKAEFTIDSYSGGWQDSYFAWGIAKIGDLVAYCVDPTRHAGHGNTYIEDAFLETLPINQRQALWEIAYFGYGFEGDNNIYRYLAAQELIWEQMTIAQVRGYGGNEKFQISWTGKYGEDIAKINEYKQIISNLRSTYYTAPSFNGTSLDVKVGETITLTDSNNVLSRFKVTVGTGLQVVSQTGNQLKIKVLDKNFTEVVTLQKKYQPTASATLSWGYQDAQKVFTAGEDRFDPLESRITLNLATGDLSLTKKGTDGKNYANVQFELSQNRSTILGTYTTGSNGSVTIPNLEEGTYYVREKSVPNPLVIDTAWKTVTVTSGTTTSFTATNELAQGQIALTKKSTNGTLISGTVFEVFNSSNQLVDTLTTNANGTVTSKKLPLGTYKVVEKSVPAPHVLDKSERTVTLSYKDQITSLVTQSLNIENKYQRSNLTLTKIENDWETLFTANKGKALENAQLSLYAKNDIYEGNTKIYSKDQKIGTATTNNQGKVSFNNLPIGEYYAKEEQAPNGYILFEGTWNISIKYDATNPTVQITNTNQTITNQIAYGKSILHKTGKNGTVLLKDAIFGLYTDNNELIGTYTTNELGIIESPDLRYGKYYWQEIQAPVGYWLDSTKHEFEITVNDHLKEVHVVVANNFIEAKIKISKVDAETRETLEGVGFKILNENGEFVTTSYLHESEIVVKEEWFTNSEGVIIIESNLPYGKYTLIESKALEGYNYIDPIDFIIDEHQNYINLDVIGNYLDLGEIENTKIYGNLTITKLDKETGLPINNVEFTIYSSDGVEVGKYRTNELGIIELKNIVYGEYIVVETYVPDPYFIDPNNNTQTVFILENQKDYYLTFENEKVLGKVVINKLDSKNQTALKDAEFTIYKSNGYTLEDFKNNFEYSYDNYGNVVSITDLGKIDLSQLIIQVGKTSEEGSITFENLELGKYFIIETDSPIGYQFNINIEEIDLIYKDFNSPIIEEQRTILNDRTQVVVEGVKKDSLTKEVIKSQDFELTLKDSEGNVMQLLKFENGIHYWLVDTFEKYYLSETKAPHGYQLSDEIIEIDTSKNLDNIVHTIEYLNSHLPDDELPPAGISNLAQEIAILFIILGGIFRHGKFKKQD